MTVLVTGGGGFLGRSIIEALRDRGEQVRSFARGDYPQLREWGIEQVRGDIADAEAVARAVAGCDAVFHTAARVEMWGPYEEFFRINTLGTRNVIAACRAHGVRKLIYTSTPSVVHGGDSVTGVDESAPYPAHFEAHYPATKALAEQEVLAANCEALATVALRPHLVWGPGDSSMMPRVIGKARKGKVRLIGAPQPVDTLYIDNAVAAHLAAYDRLEFGAALAGRAYFVTQGEPLSGQQFLNDLLSANGLAPVEKRVSVGVARTIATIVEAIWRLLRLRTEPPLTRFVVSQLSTAHWYDISAARRDLGYAPTVSYAEGMERLRASLQKRLPARAHRIAWHGPDPAFPLPSQALVLGRASEAEAQAYLTELGAWRARAYVYIRAVKIAEELRLLLASQFGFTLEGDPMPEMTSLYRLRPLPSSSDESRKTVVDILIWRSAVCSCVADIWDVIGPTPFDVYECTAVSEALFTPPALRENGDYCHACFVTPDRRDHFSSCPIGRQVDGDRYAIWDRGESG